MTPWAALERAWYASGRALEALLNAHENHAGLPRGVGTCEQALCQVRRRAWRDADAAVLRLLDLDRHEARLAIAAAPTTVAAVEETNGD